MMREAEAQVINRLAMFIWGRTPATDEDADKELDESPN
jgi:hypothetical protein